jgi:hypothetical protein
MLYLHAQMLGESGGDCGPMRTADLRRHHLLCPGYDYVLAINGNWQILTYVYHFGFLGGLVGRFASVSIQQG